MHALVIGEAIIDVIDGVDHVGGSPLNTAVALARLGRQTRFATCLGNDERGHAIRDHLRHEGVHFANDPAGAARTSVAIADVAPDGSAQYDIDLVWEPRRTDARVLQDTTVLHVGSLAAIVGPGNKEVRRLVDALRGRAWINYDLNLRPSLTGTGADVVTQIEDLAAASQLVKASDQDLKAIYPNRSIEEAAHHLLNLGPRAVVVTRGSAGSTWYGRIVTVAVAAPHVEVVDSIAAGDTFSAALIDTLWDLGCMAEPRSLTVDEVSMALTHATRAANITVTRAGADPPHRSEVDRD